MIEVSQMYRDTLATGRRDFNAYIEITLADGTQLSPITNSELRAFSIDDAASADDNHFAMLGSVVINQCKITLNNMNDQYSGYNFKFADVVVYIDYRLIDNSVERIRKGTYFVDYASRIGGAIELSCLDNLAKFDKDYSLSTLQYPVDIQTIVNNACYVCGVLLSPNSIPFSDFIITVHPDKSNTTFRQVLSWIAQIIGCYVRCDTYGRLEFTWCDLDVLADSYGGLDGATFDNNTPYASGDSADGGTFNPWNVGYVISSSNLSAQGKAHNLYYNYSQDIAVEDTVITGVNIVVDTKTFADRTQLLKLTISNGNLIFEHSQNTATRFVLDSDGNLIVTYTNPYDNFYINDAGSVIMETESATEITDEDTATSEKYVSGLPECVITIRDNDFITIDNVEQIIARLGEQLVGMRFRRATTSHMSDPTMESGDIAVLWDVKNRSYPIIVTHTTFKLGGQQRTICGVETPSTNIATRHTYVEQTYVKIKEQLLRERTARELEVKDLADRMSASAGLYSTTETTALGNIYYLHDRPNLEDSVIVWKMTAEAWAVSSDGGNTWNGGMTVDGDVITRILSAVGVDADWIKTGIIQDRSGLNYLNLDRGQFQFVSIDGTDAKKLTYNNGALTTYTENNTRGVDVAGNAVKIYNWDVDGELLGALRSVTTTTDVDGVLLGGVLGHFVGLGFDNGDGSTISNWNLGLTCGVNPIQDSDATEEWSDNYRLVSHVTHDFYKALRIYRQVRSGDVRQVGRILGATLSGGPLSENEVLTALVIGPGPYADPNDVGNGTILGSYFYLDSDAQNYFNYRRPAGWYKETTIASDLACLGQIWINNSSSVSNDSKINFYTCVNPDDTPANLRFGYASIGSWASPSNNFGLLIEGDFGCTGTKSRVVETENFGRRVFHAYETQTPYFGDLGSAQLDSSGKCYVYLDEIFLETVNSGVDYFVFLQKEGPGDLWVANKQNTYFEIEGTPDLKFMWEVKLIQKGYTYSRLDEDKSVLYKSDDESNEPINYEEAGYEQYIQYVTTVTTINLEV